MTKLNTLKLLPLNTFEPFPRATNRKAWNQLQASQLGKERLHFLQKSASQYINEGWAPLSLEQWEAYQKNGDRQSYEQAFFQRRQKLAILVLAECFQHEGFYLNHIIEGLNLICEEPHWNVPAQADRRWDINIPCDPNRVLALFSCETAAVLAESLYLLEDAFSKQAPELIQKIESNIVERIIEPAEKDIHTYYWSDGRNNWAPWCVSNILGAAMTVIKDKVRLETLINKSLLPVIQNFIDRYPADGACDEGPNYWSAGAGMMLLFFEHLNTLTGSEDIYKDPFIKSMAEFAANAHMTDSWVLNFADSRPSYSLRPALAYRFAERTQSQPLKTVVQHCMRNWSPKNNITPPFSTNICGGDLIYMLRELFWVPETEEIKPIVKNEVIWYPHTQILISRESTIADKGFILAAKGGHNGENHNHNDIGHFVLYRDGQPFIVDMGVGSYTAKTFSEQRYEILTMRSIAHNIPTINNIEQSAGSEFMASEVKFNETKGKRLLSMNLEKAYSKKCNIETLQRTFCHKQGHISVSDTYKLTAPSSVEINLYTPAVAEKRESHIILKNEGVEVRMHMSGTPLQIQIAEEELADSRLKSNWERESLTRITLKGSVSPNTPFYTLSFI